MTRKKGKRQKSPAPEIIEEEVDWSIVARSSGNDDNPTVVGEDVVRGLMWNPETRKMVPQSKLPYQVDEDIGAYHEKLCKLPESDLEAIEEAMDITSNDLAKANEQLTSDEEEEENEVVGGAAGPATANNKEDSVLSVPSILQKAFDQVEGLENSDKRMPQRRASESIARATIADDNNSVISFTSSLERIIEEGMSGGAAAAPAETEGDGASEYSAFSASSSALLRKFEKIARSEAAAAADQGMGPEQSGGAAAATAETEGDGVSECSAFSTLSSTFLQKEFEEIVRSEAAVAADQGMGPEQSGGAAAIATEYSETSASTADYDQNLSRKRGYLDQSGDPHQGSIAPEQHYEHINKKLREEKEDNNQLREENDQLREENDHLKEKLENTEKDLKEALDHLEIVIKCAREFTKEARGRKEDLSVFKDTESQQPNSVSQAPQGSSPFAKSPGRGGPRT